MRVNGMVKDKGPMSGNCKSLHRLADNTNVALVCGATAPLVYDSLKHRKRNRLREFRTYRAGM